MLDWWYGIAIAALAIVAVRFLLLRGSASRRTGDDRQAGASPAADYQQNREDARLAHMSDEDRAWVAASIDRNRERQTPVGNPDH
jgi:hypothetical protein